MSCFSSSIPCLQVYCVLFYMFYYPIPVILFLSIYLSSYLNSQLLTKSIKKPGMQWFDFYIIFSPGLFAFPVIDLVGPNYIWILLLSQVLVNCYIYQIWPELYRYQHIRSTANLRCQHLSEQLNYYIKFIQFHRFLLYF